MQILNIDQALNRAERGLRIGMPFRNSGFAEDQINILEEAVNRACGNLGVRPEDSKAREFLASAVLSLAKAGQLNVERLVIYATDQGKLHRLAR